MSYGTEFHGRGTAPAHPGRHRRGGAESWTPPLPEHRPVRHNAGEARDGVVWDGVGAPAQGTGPARSGSLPQPDRLAQSDGSGPIRGELPVVHGDLGIGRFGFAEPAYAPPTGAPPFGRATGFGRPRAAGTAPIEDTGPLGRATGPVPPRAAPGEDTGPLGRATGSGRSKAVGTAPIEETGPLGRAAGAAPLDPPVSGSLPLPQPSLPQPSLPQPRDRRPAAPLFPATHGNLPLDDGFGEDEDEDDTTAESREDQAARRTRVSLAAPASRGAETEDDDVRIYAAPPIDGLGGFTIGSVPASVTPPKTWRKAAWFATGASGAVVVGLLFAGSYLVGKPPTDQAVQGAWPGYQGAPTVLDPTDQQEPPSRHGGSAAGPDSSTQPENAAGTTSGGGAGPVDRVPATSGDDSTSRPTTSGSSPATEVPQKPPVTPAERENPVKPPWWYSFPPDAQTMGDNSEKFFNTVTTDPGTASSVTTGDLHDQGPHALSERYAGIAYFEVRKISIDQQRGVTVNTVEVTHTDGSKTIEERTLTFGDGDKIAADGQ